MQPIQIKIPLQMQAMANALEQQGAPLYLVGGAVRDAIMGITPHDWDVCGPLPPAQMQLACQASGVQFAVRNSQLGTMVLYSRDVQMEYTPFRTEQYAKGGAHRPQQVQLGVTLQQDALRRDFTAGAIYYRIYTQQLVDPLDGVQAIEQRQLRMCAPDTFRADGLRVLRLVRQAAELGFAVQMQTLKAAQSAVGLLADIVPERRQAEFSRILVADVVRAGATGTGLELLGSLDAWAYLVPPLVQGKGVTQRKDFHAYDVFEHNIQTCLATPPTLELRLAGLLHDVAKPLAIQKSGRMLGHDRLGADLVQQILGQKGLKYPKQVVSHVTQLIARHMFDLDGRAKDSTVRMRFARWGEAFVPDWIALREADVRGSGLKQADWVSQKHREIWHKMQQDGTPLSLAQLAVTGQDLMQLGIQGPNIGRILDALWMQAVRKPALNQRASLLARAKGLVSST